jgi:hypothetical protein
LSYIVRDRYHEQPTKANNEQINNESNQSINQSIEEKQNRRTDEQTNKHKHSRIQSLADKKSRNHMRPAGPGELSFHI